EHQRRADAGVERRVRAGEHKGEAPVGDHAVLGHVELVGEDLELRSGGLAAPAPAHRVDLLAPRGGEQPGLGIPRAAVRGPVGERGDERFGERVLRGGDVARARGEKGDELAVAAARRIFDRGPRVAFELGYDSTYIVHRGRTSILPWLA